jgi:hypothetical protein
MAKAWQDFGKKLDDEAKDALFAGGFDYDSYSSDEERIRAALDMLYNLPLWKKARYDDLKRLRNKYAYDEKGVDPFDISNAASIIGSWSDKVADDGKSKLTQGDQFYDQYWKADKNQREYWKDAVEGKLGKGAWEQIKKRMNARLKAETYAKIAKDRASIMEGYDPETGDVNPVDWAESAFMGIFAPRQKKAYKEGREPTMAEKVMDAGSNMAYSMIPTGKIGAAIAGPAAGLGKRVLGAVASNAVAPAAVAVGDLATGAQDYAGVKDFATDVGLGTLTNLGVNKGLAAVGSRAIPFLLGQTKAEKGSAKVLRDMLDGKPTAKEAAEGQVAEATSRAKDVLKSKAELTPENQDQLLDDLLVTEFGRIVKNDKEYAKQLQKNIKESKDWAAEKNTDAYKLVGKEPLWQTDAVTALRNRISNNRLLETKVVGRDMASKQKTFEQPLDDNIWSFLDDVPGDEAIVRETLRRHPELENLVTPESMKRKAAYAAKDFAVNKYGSDSDASKVLALVPGMEDPKKLRKEQDKARQTKKEAKAAQILDVSGYDGEDQKYLTLIKNKPEVLRGIGKEAQDSKFKNWLLLRGNDILRSQGSDLFRPTFAVE